ncbi:DUF937 domain-containing protein [Paludisphaera mucosa]|uniref:DUF937 domain-containing protein n=1 Tax=Paludisphaera mucosa TaxID=3030827 RepID=A0ABT6F6Z0_9BACT|nr:DUF937 domain-containing protein [Paludisphaera mucosa]
MSIVDVIKNQLSGDVLGKLSAAIGEPEDKTQAAAGAAVPSVLSVLANSVLTGKGLDGLLGALRNFEGTDVIASLKAPSSGGSVSPPAGGDILGSLLGPNLSTLINILSKFSGLGATAMKTLMTYLGPIILSAIAAQLKGKGGLSPANLTSFFTTEKANITKALPAGLSLADMPSIPGVPTPKVPDAGVPSWLLPVVALGLIGAAAWFFLKSPAEGPLPEVPVPPPMNRPNVTPPAPVDTAKIPPAPTDAAVTIPSVDEVTKSLSDVYTGATQALVDVKDVATAETAAPKLTDLGSKLDLVKPLWDKLPAEAKAAVAKVTVDHLDTFKALVAKAVELPGVGDKLKAILDALVAKLAGFTA